MKIWKLEVYWDKQVIRLPRKLTRLDEERIRQYLSGGMHIHSNPKRKPRHTPEKLDRIIEKVTEENTPKAFTLEDLHAGTDFKYFKFVPKGE